MSEQYDKAEVIAAMAERIVALTEMAESTAFGKIVDQLRVEGFPVDGTVLVAGPRKLAQFNIYIWMEASPELRDAARRVIDERLVRMKPSTLVAAAVEAGVFLNYPIAEDMPQKPLDEPHWLPVTLHPVPLEGTD
jgi:hypothetical protein